MGYLMKLISCNKCHDGEVKVFSHQSTQTNCEMNFGIFLPPNENVKSEKIPYLLFLSGLTCTQDNFISKAGAFKKASELGMAILIPDTSPRGESVANDDGYDLGQGAGFYIDAKQTPWSKNFKMESYLIQELLPLAEIEFGLDSNKKSISGHSMGGHGALTLHYKHPEKFVSCSAFSPIVAPAQVPWGEKAFSAYIGGDKNEWKIHDASELAKQAKGKILDIEILIDQGLDDQFLIEQLKPDIFEEACKQSGQKLNLRKHEGYDHSYFFIQTFIEDHLKFHAEKMLKR